ncbi:MAG: hypothetical protein R3C05_08155 [Pirellulaceae bacterium]
MIDRTWQPLPRKCRRPATSTAAFTLLELLLVLALAAALAAMAVPAVGVLLADGRIKRAGDEIRIVLAQTRLTAMRSGRTQMFRCEIGTNRYTVQPWNDASDMTEAADMLGKTLPGMAGTQAGGAIYTPPEPTVAQVQELPEGIRFADERVESSQRAMFIEQQAALVSEEGWSQPILFYADGTTSTAVVRVKSENGSVVRVQLRGLTGEAMVSEVTSDET